MTWAAISALAGAAGVLALLVAHVVTYAYQRGRTDHRLDALERTQSENGQTQTVLAALAATVAALKETVDRFERGLERIYDRVFEGRET
jgi:uncharacterized coiled-coil protein SlyX